jgi:methylamine dehydrogenase accessory protein MauD
MIASQVLMWIVLGALALTVMALARQVGVLHERIAPMGALANDRGPEVGDTAPRFTLTSFSGAPVSLAAKLDRGRAQMLLFVSPGCPICKKLLPVAKSFARSERLDVVYIGDGDQGEQRAMVAQHDLDASHYVSAAEVGLSFKVGKLPYAILLDHEGTIVAKGLVNSREHLESLIVAKETGFASIQSYLRATETAASTSV